MPAIRTHTLPPNASSALDATPPLDTTSTESQQPRRPPNAWILFRRAMVKNMPPPSPGKPAQPQAEKSKVVAKMWQDAPDEVKAYYEHLSNVAKAEHLIKYPNYRFKPMKKADKERLRAEKQAEKERMRATRRARPRARARAPPSVPQDPPPPLFTTTPRHGLPGLPSPVSVTSMPPTTFTAGQPGVITPPSDNSTPSGSLSITPTAEEVDRDAFTLHLPPPPSTTIIPSLVVPQPGRPYAPLSMAEGQASVYHTQMSQDDSSFNSLMFEFLPSRFHPPQRVATQPISYPVQYPPAQQMWDSTGTSMSSDVDNMIYVYGTGEVFNNQVFDENLGMSIDTASFMHADPAAIGTINASSQSIEDITNLEDLLSPKDLEELLASFETTVPSQLASNSVAGPSQSNNFHGAPPYLVGDPS